jgi:tetratricopeptide (TPR) repeat protein
MIATTSAVRQRTNRCILIGLLTAVGAGGLAWGVWEFANSRRWLDQAIEYADAGELDLAAGRIRAGLATDPGNDAARLLLAQIILKRPSSGSDSMEESRVQSGAEALDQLREVQPSNPRMAVTYQLCLGNALNRLARFDDAEAAWLEALRLDTMAPEAGFNLLNLYYKEARDEDARRLALRLVEIEPDAHDRALLLLELVRPDARPPAPGAICKAFEPAVKMHPDEYHCALALGLALVRAGQVEKGIDQLERTAGDHPDRAEAWDCLLLGLDESGQPDRMEEVMSRVPASQSDSPRLLKHRGRVAQAFNRWKEAVDLYRIARAAEPYNRAVEFRLSRALRHVGQNDEANRIELRVRQRDVAIQELRPLFDEATSTLGPGVHRQPDLCRRIAEARERMQLPDEARAWHQLALSHDPTNESSKAALVRLEREGGRQ